MTAPQTETRYLRVIEYAAEYGISRRTAYEHVRRGVVPSIRLGGIIRIPRAALEQHLAATAEGPGERAA
jgi:excisionase family DNA binding protein